MKRRDKNLCPHCGKPSEWEGNPHRPFCSERCKLIDLGRWASGKYRIPGEKIRTDEKSPDEEEKKK
jgi:endogenous inhibitor of DNA gyrase (YacG/DUF329 family)